MERIHRIRKVPKEVRQYFEVNFPPKRGFTYKFYWYKQNQTLSPTPKNKIYGCEVYKNRRFYHNATQGNISWFRKHKNKKIRH